MEILLTRLPERVCLSISEREVEHDHGGDGGFDGDVEVVPNKLGHADVEDDGCDGVHAHDVGDGLEGHDVRT